MTRQAAHYASTRKSGKTWRVYHGDRLVLESSDAIELEEHHDGKDFAVVVYFPLSAMDGPDLERSDTSSHCPIKGDACYWNWRGVADAVWSYPRPLPEVAAIGGRIAFDPRKGFRVTALN